MQVAFNLTVRMVVLWVALVALGMFAGGFATKASLTRENVVACGGKEFAVAAADREGTAKLCEAMNAAAKQVDDLTKEVEESSKPATMTCGSISYIYMKALDSDDLHKACSDLTDLQQKQKNADADKAQRLARVSCLTPSGDEIGSMSIDKDNVDKYNAICDKYKPQFDKAYNQAKKLPGRPELSPFVQQVNRQYWADLSQLTMQRSPVLDNYQQLRTAQTQLEEKVRQAGGGYSLSGSRGPFPFMQ